MFMWVKKIIRIREWSDYDRSKGIFAYVKSLFLNLFTLKDWDENPPKDFLEVVNYYHLDQKELKNRALIFKRLSLTFLLLFLVICAYALYMFYQGFFFVSAVVVCMSLIALCLAFRYHFYLTVLQNKRLDFSFKDWMNHILKR